LDRHWTFHYHHQQQQQQQGTVQALQASSIIVRIDF
jgi:hypothetical protein